MDNHYHLLIETPEGKLSKGMRQVGADFLKMLMPLLEGQSEIGEIPGGPIPRTVYIIL